jgi:hypothetical protein
MRQTEITHACKFLVIYSRQAGVMGRKRAWLRDGSPVGVAYASSLLSLEHVGVTLDRRALRFAAVAGGNRFRLIAEVVARAKESGWRALDLEVEASHQRAISLYARHNFDLILEADFTEFSEMGPRASS